MTLYRTYPPILLTDEDAAYYLGISVTKLNRLQAAGRIIPKAIDGKRGFLRDDLDAFARALPDWEGRTLSPRLND